MASRQAPSDAEYLSESEDQGEIEGEIEYEEEFESWDSAPRRPAPRKFPLSSWQRQGILVVIALLGALYQVRKASSIFESQDEEAARQLELAGSHLERLADADLQFFIGQAWHPPQDVKDPRRTPHSFTDAKTGTRRALIAVSEGHCMAKGHQAATADLPKAMVICAEIFVDPVQRRRHSERETRRAFPSWAAAQQQQGSSTQSHSRDARHRSKGSARHAGTEKSIKRLPLLGMWIYHASMEPAARELQRLGLVDRVLQAFETPQDISSAASGSPHVVKKTLKPQEENSVSSSGSVASSKEAPDSSSSCQSSDASADGSSSEFQNPHSAETSATSEACSATYD